MQVNADIGTLQEGCVSVASLAEATASLHFLFTAHIEAQSDSLNRQLADGLHDMCISCTYIEKQEVRTDVH
jgi:hypothetical protein